MDTVRIKRLRSTLTIRNKLFKKDIEREQLLGERYIEYNSYDNPIVDIQPGPNIYDEKISKHRAKYYIGVPKLERKHCTEQNIQKYDGDHKATIISKYHTDFHLSVEKEVFSLEYDHQETNPFAVKRVNYCVNDFESTWYSAVRAESNYVYSKYNPFVIENYHSHQDDSDANLSQLDDVKKDFNDSNNPFAFENMMNYCSDKFNQNIDVFVARKNELSYSKYNPFITKNIRSQYDCFGLNTSESADMNKVYNFSKNNPFAAEDSFASLYSYSLILPENKGLDFANKAVCGEDEIEEDINVMDQDISEDDYDDDDSYGFLNVRKTVSEHPTMGFVLLEENEMGLEVYTNVTQCYRAWEDVLLMDPEESIPRSWSIQFPIFR